MKPIILFILFSLFIISNLFAQQVINGKVLDNNGNPLRDVSVRSKKTNNGTATYEKVGYKLGQWKNVGWWQLQLKEYNDDPKPPIPFKDIEPGQLKLLLNET